MTRKILQVDTILFFFLLSLAGDVFANSPITSELKQTIEKVIQIVSDPDLKKTPKFRREKLRETIGFRFNYYQMVRRSLARNYKNRTNKEREEFTGLFKKLLENSYASKIENYQDETIN